MARTRIWEAAHELNYFLSDYSSGIGAVGSWPTHSNAVARTGSRSLKLDWSFGGGNGARKDLAVPLTQVSLAAAQYTNVLDTSRATHALISLYNNLTELVTVGQLINTYDITLNVLGVQVDVATIGASWLGAWRHIGIDAKIDGAAGWVRVYWEGNEILAFDGNTGAAGVNRIELFPTWLTGGSASSYFDDVILDSTAGEVAPVQVPDHRLYVLFANGNGSYSDFTGQDGNKVDNYLNVDEGATNDGDTTYNESMTLDERDSYALATQAIPANWVAYGVRPMHVARRTDAGVLTEALTFLRLAGVDADDAASQVLSTNYTDDTSCLKGDFRLTKPGGGAWDQAAVDALEVGIQAKGPF